LPILLIGTTSPDCEALAADTVVVDVVANWTVWLADSGLSGAAVLTAVPSFL